MPPISDWGLFTMNLINFIPKKINNKEINIINLNNKLIISAKGTGSPKQLTLENEIKINNFLFEVIGLYFGDGLNTKNHSGNRRVAFANSNYKLHEYWLRFLEYFGINKNQLFAQIGIGQNINKETVLNYWLTKTKIPKDRFARVSKCKDKSCKEGVLSIEFNSVIFKSIFDNIFDYCITILPKRKNHIPPFIAGLFAAEGRVAIRNNSLNYLGIAIKDDSRREFVKSLLKKIGIRPSKDNQFQEIIIPGYINSKIFNDTNMAKIHPKKSKLFNNGFYFLSKSKVPALTKIKVIDLLKKQSMTRFQIADKLNMDISLIHKMLKDLEMKGIVKRTGKEKSILKSRDIWSLVKIPKDTLSLMKYHYQ